LRVWSTRPAFSVADRTKSTSTPQPPKMMTQVERSPEDEIFLTELALDDKEFTSYEISSKILFAERAEENPNGNFRCFLESKTNEFFIEIADESTMKLFNKSELINVIKLAEGVGADTVYVCVSKAIQKQGTYLKNFLFIGFEKLTAEEQKEISMTRTHNLLKYSVNSDDEEQDD